MDNFKIYEIRGGRWQITAINFNLLSHPFATAILWRSFPTYCDALDFLHSQGVQ